MSKPLTGSVFLIVLHCGEWRDLQEFSLVDEFLILSSTYSSAATLAATVSFGMNCKFYRKSTKTVQQGAVVKEEEGEKKMLHLDVELLGGCAKSLEYIQCGVAAVHVLRVEVTLHEFTGLLFDPGFNLVSEKTEKNKNTHTHR